MKEVKSLACETLSIVVDSGVVTVTLNRPETLNAFNMTMQEELDEVLLVADGDPEVRAIVITGAGRSFSSGYDLDADLFSSERGRSSEVLETWWNIANKEVTYRWRLMEIGKPVIAAVNGWCLGGGFWYTLFADITIAAETATFGQPEIRENQDAIFLFAALCGWKNALRYTLTGDHFDAQEALRIGVVNEVVKESQVLERAQELARRIALVPREATRYNKRMIVGGLVTMGLKTALEQSAWLSAIIHASMDSPDLDDLNEVRARDGVRASLRFRDDPFRPEPGGPRSEKR